jgi:hypothetical protein
VPCVLEDCAVTASLRFEGRGKLMMHHKENGTAVDTAWKKDQAPAGYMYIMVYIYIYKGIYI